MTEDEDQLYHDLFFSPDNRYITLTCQINLPIYALWKVNMNDKTKRNTSHVMRKPVFGVYDQVRLKLACSVDETS